MRAKIAPFANYSNPSVLATDPVEARQARRYGWADILFDPLIAETADRSSEAFKRAIAWYGAFRYLYGHRNRVLDGLLDAGYKPEIEIGKSEYRLYIRTWLKRVKLAGWDE